jgi:hypothetical protein
MNAVYSPHPDLLRKGEGGRTEKKMAADFFWNPLPALRVGEGRVRAISHLTFTLCLTLLLSACSSAWTHDDDTFTNTYTEILITREQFASDTARANASIRGILQTHGFTAQTFQQRFQELSATPDKLRQILDTARLRARRIADDEAMKERDSIAKAATITTTTTATTTATTTSSHANTNAPLR